MATAIKTVIGTAASGLSSAGIGAAVPSIRTARAHRPEPRWGPEALRLKELEEQLANLRSEEHTSELQSRLHLVCRLLLEKKKPYQHTLRQEEQPQNA